MASRCCDAAAMATVEDQPRTETAPLRSTSTVAVSGAEGAGTAFVPVLAVAERRLPMSFGMGATLIGAGLILFLGAITIFGAAVREVLRDLRVADQPVRKLEAYRYLGSEP